MQIIETVICVNPIIGLVNQAVFIRRQRKVGSFSSFIPAIILVTCIARICFWFVKPFAAFIVAQTLLIIIVNIVLLKFCVQYRTEPFVKESSFMRRLWNWETFAQYVIFLAGFGFFLGAITILAVTYELKMVGHIVGLMMTALETSTPVPQIIRNYRRKSTEGISKGIIASWLSNDFIKTAYFVYISQPYEFVAIGAIQIVLDLIIILQFYRYGAPKDQTLQKGLNNSKKE